MVARTIRITIASVKTEIAIAGRMNSWMFCHGFLKNETYAERRHPVEDPRGEDQEQGREPEVRAR